MCRSQRFWQPIHQLPRREGYCRHCVITGGPGGPADSTRRHWVPILSQNPHGRSIVQRAAQKRGGIFCRIFSE
jgi:hypothetical protein